MCHSHSGIYLWSCSGICVDAHEIVEANVDQQVVSVRHIHSEHDWMHSVPQEGNHVHVESAHHQRYTSQNQEETHLRNTM